ncbi:MAG: HD domain-containing phosphohydrolase [Pseudomonadota bacterium]
MQKVASEKILAGQLDILIVDDEPGVRATLAEFFTTEMKHRVVGCGDAASALREMEGQRFDCAFVDLNLPDMPGVQLIKKLKERSCVLPVVVITGHPSMEAAISAMRQGASDFVAKPFRMEFLEGVLTKVMRERDLLLDNLRLTEKLSQKEAVERLYRELERKMREQSFCYAINDRLARVGEIEKLYQLIVDLADEVTEASRIGLLILDPDTGDLVLVGAKGKMKESIGRRVGAVGVGLAGKALLQGKPAVCRMKGGKEWPGGGGPAVAVPMHIKGEAFGVIVAAGRKEPFAEQELRLLSFLAEKGALCVENLALYESVMQNLHATLRALVGAIEAKDSYTEQHSKRVTTLAVAIATEMSCAEEEVEALRFAGHLHDIGKIGIRDHILLKPGRLTAEEYTMVKAHPVIGQSIVRHLGLLPLEQDIIRHHHESWDGTGYPDGLAGEQIPLLSRILAVADAYDAMTSCRPYRQAKSREDSIEELRHNRYRQFDGQVVEACIRVLDSLTPELHERGGRAAGQKTLALMQPGDNQTA